MWWLQLVAVCAYTGVLVMGFLALRRGEVIGRRSTYVALLAAGVVLDLVGVALLIVG